MCRRRRPEGLSGHRALELPSRKLDASPADTFGWPRAESAAGRTAAPKTIAADDRHGLSAPVARPPPMPLPKRDRLHRWSVTWRLARVQEAAVFPPLS